MKTSVVRVQAGSRSRQAIGSWVLFFLVAAGLWLSAVFHERERSQAEAAQTLQYVAQASAAGVNKLFSKVDRIADRIRSADVIPRNQLTLTTKLIRAAGNLREANAVMILSTTGQVIASSQMLLDRHVHFESADWFRAGLNTSPDMLNLFRTHDVDPSGHGPELILTRSIEGDHGLPSGLLVVSFKHGGLKTILAPQWLPEGVTVSLLADTAASPLLSTRDDKGNSVQRLPPILAGLIRPALLGRNAPLLWQGFHVRASFSSPFGWGTAPMATLGWDLWIALGFIALGAIACVARSPAGAAVTTLGASLEEARRAAEAARGELEAVRCDRDRILASVGHDVRTPMTSILGLTSLLQETDLQDEPRRWVGMIGASCETLLAMLNGLLEIARGESGQAQLMLDEVEVADLIREVAGVLDNQAREKGLELRTRIDGELSGVWRTDPTRLRQVLFNLAGNAIKFTGSGYVEVAALVVTSGSQGPQIRISVADTGPGIPEEDRVRIFRAFERGSLSSNAAEGGLGLGLAICQENAALMGGVLTLESTMGVGSEFTFEFPAERAHEGHRSTPFSGRAGVVVGFADAQRRRWAVQLEATGFTVETASDGFIGLGIVERTALAVGGVDLVVLDGAMRGMAPDVFVRRLQTFSFSQNTRIIWALGQEDDFKPENLSIDVFIPYTEDLDDISVSVNRAMEDASALQMIHEHAPSPPGGRVLVVEDNKINQSLLSAFLVRRGFSVFTADNGEDAVRAASRGNFDAILMDIQMPGMDGFEAARRIRAIGGAMSVVPILALTALTGAVVKKRSLDAGMTSIIEKPLNLLRLASTIRAYVSETRRHVVGEPQSSNQAGREFNPELTEDGDEIADPFLEALVAEFGVERARACLGDFVADATTRISRLNELIPGWESEAILRLCHDLSGMAGNFGAVALSEALDELAEAVRRGSRELAEERLLAVENLGLRLRLTLMYHFESIIIERQRRRAA